MSPLRETADESRSRQVSSSSVDSNGSLLLSNPSTHDEEDARLELAQHEVQVKKLRVSISRRRSVSGASNREDKVKGILEHYEKVLAETETRMQTLRREIGIDDKIPSEGVAAAFTTQEASAPQLSPALAAATGLVPTPCRGNCSFHEDPAGRDFVQAGALVSVM